MVGEATMLGSERDRARTARAWAGTGASCEMVGSPAREETPVVGEWEGLQRRGGL